MILITAWKVSEYEVFSGPYFPVFGLNKGKYGPEKNSVFGHFSGSEWFINFQSVSYIYKTTYCKCQLPFPYQIEHPPCYHPFPPLIMIFWESCTKKWCFCFIGTDNIYFLVNIVLPLVKKWKMIFPENNLQKDGVSCIIVVLKTWLYFLRKNKRWCFWENKIVLDQKTLSNKLLLFRWESSGVNKKI